MSGSSKFHDENGKIIPDQPEDYSREDYLAKQIVNELGVLLASHARDVPHRFRAPAVFGEYFSNLVGNQSTYYSVPINTSNSSLPMTLQITTRPSNGIMELAFQDHNGWRVFTLEIEYAVPEKR